MSHIKDDDVDDGEQPKRQTLEEYLQNGYDILPETMSQEQKDRLVNLMRTLYVDRSTVVDHGKDHVRGGPLLDVYSVCLNPLDQSYLDDNNPWEIYGTVQVTNGLGESYNIYNYEKDDPEIIEEFYVQRLSPGHRNVSITLFRSEPVVCPLPETHLLLRLWDKVRGLELANGSITISFDHLDRNGGFEEEAGVKHVGGKDGTASIHYHYFPVAVYGEVNVEVANKPHTEDHGDTIDVYGRVFALREIRDGGAKRSYEIELFDEVAELPIKVKSSDRIGLHRNNYIVVPAYSSLTSGIQLWDSNIHHLTIPPLDAGFNSARATICDPMHVRVTVLWSPPYLNGFSLIPEKKDPEAESSSERAKKSKLDLKTFRSEKQSTTIRFFRPAMELFSIYVVRDHDQPLNLYGTIKFVSDNESFIFNRSISEAVSIVGKAGSLEIVAPSNYCFEGSYHKIKVNLLDDQNREVCKGSISINEQELVNLHTISWYDRRICSIISGEQGYAAVHYTVFSDAVQATVKVLLVSDSSSNAIQVTNVSGKIVARYSNYFYKTSSEKDRYSSILFSERHLKLSADNMIQLPLAKSKLHVPKGSALIISFDLLVRTVENVEGHILKGIAEFEIGASSHWMIYDKGCAADVSIEWKNFD